MVRWGAPNCKPMQLCIEDKIWKSYWKPSHNNINKSWTKTSNIIRSCNKNNFHHLHCGAHTQPQTTTSKTNTTTNNLWKTVRNKPQTTPLALPSTFIQKHTSQRTAKADQKPYNIIQQENCSSKLQPQNVIWSKRQIFPTFPSTSTKAYLHIYEIPYNNTCVTLPTPESNQTTTKPIKKQLEQLRCHTPKTKQSIT